MKTSSWTIMPRPQVYPSTMTFPDILQMQLALQLKHPSLPLLTGTAAKTNCKRRYGKAMTPTLSTTWND